MQGERRLRWEPPAGAKAGPSAGARPSFPLFELAGGLCDGEPVSANQFVQSPALPPRLGWAGLSNWADGDRCQRSRPHCSDLASFHSIDSASRVPLLSSMHVCPFQAPGCSETHREAHRSSEWLEDC